MWTGRQPDPDDFGEQFLPWERKLEQSGGPFLGGARPDMRDVMLFGILQCHCSIPVPPVATLREDARLGGVRAWIGAMHERFRDYPHLYSGVYFEPHLPAPEPAPPVERAAFWLGSAFMLACFPITVPLILFLASRVQRGP